MATGWFFNTIKTIYLELFFSNKMWNICSYFKLIPPVNTSINLCNKCHMILYYEACHSSPEPYIQSCLFINNTKGDDGVCCAVHMRWWSIYLYGFLPEVKELWKNYLHSCHSFPVLPTSVLFLLRTFLLCSVYTCCKWLSFSGVIAVSLFQFHL